MCSEFTVSNRFSVPMCPKTRTNVNELPQINYKPAGYWNKSNAADTGVVAASLGTNWGRNAAHGLLPMLMLMLH